MVLNIDILDIYLTLSGLFFVSSGGLCTAGNRCCPVEAGFCCSPVHNLSRIPVHIYGNCLQIIPQLFMLHYITHWHSLCLYSQSKHAKYLKYQTQFFARVNDVFNIYLFLFIYLNHIDKDLDSCFWFPIRCLFQVVFADLQ